jgi:hypothetical protein
MISNDLNEHATVKVPAHGQQCPSVGTSPVSLLAPLTDLAGSHRMQVVLLNELPRLIEIASRDGTASALAESGNGKSSGATTMLDNVEPAQGPSNAANHGP